MAEPEQVARLRPMIAEPTSTVYDDVVLGQMIDQAGGSLYLAAAEIWQQKSASLSTLVDTSESGSSHSLSQLSKAATAQATYYAGKYRETQTPVVSSERSTTVRRAERR